MSSSFQHPPATERNAPPIADALATVLQPGDNVFEIGSGTGYHALYMARRFPAVRWQPSERPEQVRDLVEIVAEAAVPNVRTPVAFDVLLSPWSMSPVDVLLTVNTFHIMPDDGWREVVRRAPHVLKPSGRLCVYGPMRYDDRPLEPSNLDFEAFLQRVDPERGIRNADEIRRNAEREGLRLAQDIAMPSNNRFLVFQRTR